MTAIKYRDNKLGRYRKGVRPLNQRPSRSNKRKADKNGYYLMASKFAGTCFMCGERYEEGKTVYFNPNNEAGKKCAHDSCYRQAA